MVQRGANFYICYWMTNRSKCYLFLFLSSSWIQPCAQNWATTIVAWEIALTPEQVRKNPKYFSTTNIQSAINIMFTDYCSPSYTDYDGMFRFYMRLLCVRRDPPIRKKLGANQKKKKKKRNYLCTATHRSAINIMTTDDCSPSFAESNSIFIFSLGLS